MSDHSTDPDKATGWKPKQIIARLRQFPLIFMNPSVDIVSKSLTSFGSTHAYRVVYMGPRHNSNIKAFKSYCSREKTPKVVEGAAYGAHDLKKYTFKHAHESQKFFPIRVSEYRLFIGMNPTYRKDDLRFDSDFECGNLDLAIYVNPAEYDLFMRVDSNTKGHTAWFYFKVWNPTAHLSSQKIKFNIINHSKKYLLYKDGMKPFVFTKSSGQWAQSCSSITYHKRKLRYDGAEQIQFQCLSFVYEFKDNEQVYFAYCVPYSYSFLLHRLQEFKSKAAHLIRVSTQAESTGGLPIPVLTITNFASSGDKPHAVCIARLHPGETQGSWMMDGFISRLLSPQSHFLRDKIVFKIIPMVNVDGVVLGNFRTGIMGRDLNRSFNNCDEYNEISMIRKLASECSPQIFLDFHGHSSKKNVFIYGPDYKLEDKNYLLCRALPKLISKETEAFRYYSCSFNISRQKSTTGRAVMLRQFTTEFSYTVEASAHGYGPSKSQSLFTCHEYQSVGVKIVNALSEFVKILRALSKREEIRATKEAGKLKEQRSESSRKRIKSDFLDRQQRLQIQSKQTNMNRVQHLEFLTDVQKNLLQQLLQDQALLEAQDKQQGSQDSDCQDSTNDYSQEDMQAILQVKKQQKPIKKQKTKQSQKKRRRKLQLLPVSSNKNIQFSPNKIALPKHKSFSKKETPEHYPETIDVMEHQTTINSRATRLIEKNQALMQSLLSRKVSSSYAEEFQQPAQNVSMSFSRNYVHYDWSRKKKEKQLSTKQFKFEIPEYIEPVVVRRKQSDKYAELSKSKSIQKQRSADKSKQKVIQPKKNPMLSIKKSGLPTLGRSTEIIREPGLDRADRSMLSQILEQHERKRKVQKNYRILFL